MQQGDRLGPLLSALGLDGAILTGRTQAESINDPADLTAFSLDDGTVGEIPRGYPGLPHGF